MVVDAYKAILGPIFTGASGCETTDWLPIGDKCFLFNPNRTDWFSARERCQDLGGDLAVISNMEENTAVEGKNTYRHSISYSYFIDRVKVNSRYLISTYRPT